MKTLIESKTFWFGVLQILFGATGFLAHFLDSQMALSLIVTGLGTIGFRVNTTTGISSVI